MTKFGKALVALGNDGGTENRDLNLTGYIDLVNQYQAMGWPAFGQNSTLGSKQEEVPATFQGYVEGAYKSNGVIFACMMARMLLFTEARFQFRRRVLGRPGEMFGSPALKPLEEPWSGGTTGQLLTRTITDADLGGNFFGVRRSGNRIKRLRPDWVTIVLGSKSDSSVGFGDVDAEILGFIYEPGGPHAASSGDTKVFLREEVAHFAPIPDPLASFRGMSWLTPVIREVMGDQAATTHKLKFFEQGATPNMVVSLDANIQAEAFEQWLELFEKEAGGGVANAYKTMYLGAGAKAEVVGADLKSIDFKAVQALGENRIASAARVPGIIAGFSEGLEAATYSNFGLAKRHFADSWARPYWRDVCGAFAPIIPVPAGAELWYDDRDISFLQEDRKDEAEIQQAEAMTLKTLIEAGFEPDTAVTAVTANDFTRLTHTGLVSVQLQEPGSESAGEGDEEPSAPPPGAADGA